MHSLTACPFIPLAALLTLPIVAAGSKPHAFATLLCDSDTIAGVEVLSASLGSAGHNETLLVLGRTGLSSSAQQIIASLPNTLFLLAKPLPYPFTSLPARLAIHKPCRFLKLHLWSLTRWSKIVFLDADTVVRAPIGDLFEYPDFSAVKDPVGMNYNTGVLVVAPSLATHALLVAGYRAAGSYNAGDQGALNALVRFGAWTPLPRRFNVFHSAPAEATAAAKVLHFSGDAKPWKFWMAEGHGRISLWAMKEWCRFASASVWSACRLNGALETPASARKVPKHFQDMTDETKMAVLIATYNRDEWRNLTLFYGALDFVREVFVVWHKIDRPRVEPPHTKVRFIYPTSDSLNNRFLLPADALSRAVYVCDDDVFPSKAALELALASWRQNPWRLVGFFPRRWHSPPPIYRWSIAGGYNIVLTKGMIAHRDFLTAYNAFLPRRLTDVVDRYKNCEDILFNMMAVGVTGLPPVAVLTDDGIRDIGGSGGISDRKDGKHMHFRSVCVENFVRLGHFSSVFTSRASILPAGYMNQVVDGSGWV